MFIFLHNETFPSTLTTFLATISVGSEPGRRNIVPVLLFQVFHSLGLVAMLARVLQYPRTAFFVRMICVWYCEVPV